jgi:hypothetical protein
MTPTAESATQEIHENFISKRFSSRTRTELRDSMNSERDFGNGLSV